MTITLEIPDELLGALAAPGQDIARAALEALAVDGYRSNRLTEADICQLLGFETRLEVHGFLKEREALLPYAIHPHPHDREIARHVARPPRPPRPKEPGHDRRRR